MRNQIIAKRYSKALFNLAEEARKVEQYGQELDNFVRFLGELPEFADALRNPLYPEATRKAVFSEVVQKLDMAPMMRSFINLLIEKNRVQHIEEIAKYYHRLIDESANVARAQVKAAIDLNEQAKKEIAQALERTTGKKIVIEFEKDPGLIGGILAQIGDFVLDGSVKRQLLNFKESLKRGAVG